MLMLLGQFFTDKCWVLYSYPAYHYYVHVKYSTVDSSKTFLFSPNKLLFDLFSGTKTAKEIKFFDHPNRVVCSFHEQENPRYRILLDAQ